MAHLTDASRRAHRAVLGIWDGHDAGVAVAVDGELVVAISEERLSRKKRASGFPFEALSAGLSEAGLVASDIEKVIVPGRYGRLMHRLADPLYRGSSPDKDPLSVTSRAVRWLETGMARLPGVRDLEHSGSRGVLAARLRRLGFTAPIGFIDHHEAHAHTARLVGAPDAMLVTMDGYGDGLAGTFDATGPKRRDFKSPGHSLALVYGAITRLLGFGEGDEGKVMGLAASGDKERLADFFERCMSAGGCDPTLGGRQQREWLKSQPREDVAAALQARTESLAKEWIEQSRGNRVRLAVSGGLFANVSLNGRLAEAFDHFDCFPHMGDGGLCVGALASAVPELRFGLPFTGPTWTDEQVRRAIDDGGLCGERSEDPEGQLLETILDGGITARFYGRSEFGPRALGHRSILMRADRPGLADRLNQQLGRNDFMPFAPIRRLGAGSLTMTVVVEADRTLRERCPAAVHVDGSVRTQLAHPRADPGLWSLLGRAEAAGLPALINTSFNRHGEPIVESPTDAVRTFKAAGLDVMQMGRFVVRAKPGSIDRP